MRTKHQIIPPPLSFEPLPASICRRAQNHLAHRLCLSLSLSADLVGVAHEATPWREPPQRWLGWLAWPPHGLQRGHPKCGRGGLQATPRPWGLCGAQPPPWPVEKERGREIQLDSGRQRLGMGSGWIRLVATNEGQRWLNGCVRGLILCFSNMHFSWISEVSNS